MLHIFLAYSQSIAMNAKNNDTLRIGTLTNLQIIAPHTNLSRLILLVLVEKTMDNQLQYFSPWPHIFENCLVRY